MICMLTILASPLSLETSIRSIPVSVQYRFRATQSTAMPSGFFISETTMSS